MADSESQPAVASVTSPNQADAIVWPLPPEDWARQFRATPELIDESRPGRLSQLAHVWAAALNPLPETLAAFAESLAQDEQERARRFHFPVHRDRFIAGRGLLRRLLGSYLCVKPEAVQFGYGPNGKPMLAGHPESRPLSFNVAHAEDLLLIAVVTNGSIGVDVEKVRELSDSEDLVRRFFSSNECSQFLKLSAAQKAAAFFNLWTRKEAWLKATGEGITHLLNQVEVSFLPGEPAHLVRLPADYLNGSIWSLYELAPQAGFTAALAIAGDDATVHWWRYSTV